MELYERVCGRGGGGRGSRGYREECSSQCFKTTVIQLIRRWPFFHVFVGGFLSEFRESFIIIGHLSSHSARKKCGKAPLNTVPLSQCMCSVMSCPSHSMHLSSLIPLKPGAFVLRRRTAFKGKGQADRL